MSTRSHPMLPDRFLFPAARREQEPAVPLRSQGRRFPIGFTSFSIFILAIASAAAGCGAESAPSPPDSVTVMTWNLEWFYDEYRGDNFSDLAKQKAAPNRTAWAWRRDAVAKQLASAQPTIIGFQEIENQRVLYYLRQSLQRNHQRDFESAFIEGRDYFTEQDVGFLFDERVDLVRISRHGLTRAMRQSPQYDSLSKHLEAVYQIPLGDGTSERLTILNVHLRSGDEARLTRTQQARAAHAWLASRVADGENVILLGDFNTDERQLPAGSGSDMAAAMGHDTEVTNDDLIDLHRYLPEDQRRTHLLPGKQFDHVLVSPSLIEDAPRRRDLVFAEVRREEAMAVQNGIDDPGEHWQRYWEIPEGDRDLSDHWPIAARFDIR